MNYEDLQCVFFGGDSLVGLPRLSLDQSMEFLFNQATRLGHLTAEELASLPALGSNVETLPCPVGCALKESLQPHIQSALRFAQRHLSSTSAAGRLHAMIVDEVAAINLYTQETVLYRIMNRLLGARDNAQIWPFIPFIKLLLHALYKLPAVVARVDRGIPVHISDLDEEYTKGIQVAWWRFSSTTRTIGILEDFLSNESDGTIFTIDILTGVDIKSFSDDHMEDEVLLLPGTTYQVYSTVSLVENESMQVTMVQLKEIENPSQLGYTREAFNTEYIMKQTPRWCCPFCFKLFTFGRWPVTHDSLAVYFQQDAKFYADSGSRLGGSCISWCCTLIGEFCKSLLHQAYSALLICVFLALAWGIIKLFESFDVLFPTLSNHFHKNHWEVYGLLCSAVVIIPCVHCYHTSEYRGCWDTRRLFYYLKWYERLDQFLVAETREEELLSNYADQLLNDETAES